MVNIRKLIGMVMLLLVLPLVYVPLHAQAPDGVAQLSGDAIIAEVEEAEDGYEVLNLAIRDEPLKQIVEKLKGKDDPRIAVNAPSDSSADSALLLLTQEQVQLMQQELPGLTVELAFRDVVNHQPLDWISLNEAARLMSASVDNLEVLIEIHYAVGEHQYPMERLARSLGMSLFSTPVYFTASVQAGDQELVIDTYGNQFAERVFHLPQTGANQPLTAVRYDWAAHEFRYVPTVIQRESGAVQAVVKSNQNSPLFIARFSRSFADTTNHWAKVEIEQLASSLLIQGTTEQEFAPDRAISRAEFAALLVRAVGASSDPSAVSVFRDVTPSDWYHDAVKAANGYGLVEGFENGQFRPDATVTREQMAAMIMRSLAVLEVKYDEVSGAELERFSDHGAIQDWAEEAVAQATALGMINGMEDGSFRPAEPATRAQAAVMLKRFLQQAGLLET